LGVRVDRLARHLRQQGVRSDTFVGICMERSVEMVVAIYAILKAGGAYVPLSPEDPPARLAAIIDNAGLRLIITQEGFAASLPTSGIHRIVLTADPGGDPEVDENASLGDVAIAPDDLAYMIYTSGSTGEPKGVLIQHKAIFNRIVWMQETYRLSPADRVLQKTPYTFDVSVWEFLWPLTVGATLVVAEPGGHVVPSYLSRLIRQEQVTCCHFVPSVLKLFLACPRIETLPLRLVFCSGEALPFDVQRMFMSRSGAQLHNLYGPTEAAVDVSWWHCQAHVHEGRVPVGKPIANIQLYILDEDLRPVAAGVPGELYIAGIGLAKGYWQKPQLTEERFVSNPLAPIAGERMYKTGDIARFLPDGNIEYLGRNDDQVKINGARMELGEIESAMRGHPSVADVVVVAKQTEQGTAQLAAYLVSEEENVTEAVLDSIKSHIAQRLPQPMIPRQFAFIEKIPLTRNGKADRKALVGMDSRRMEARA
jgi:amino acid adenylation domain-containing protein